MSNDGQVWSDPEAFVVTKTWDLSLYGGTSQDGSKTVYVLYENALGRWMTIPVTDEIDLDRTAPTGTILIDDGAEVTGSFSVALSLWASDDGAASTRAD